MTGTGETMHLTTVAIDGRGVLIEGASGAGKSDLALRLIDRGAELVSDDYTELSVEDGQLVARAPASIAGRIEVRGVGIMPVSHRESAVAALLVRLTGTPERLPEPATRTLLGVDLPMLALAPLPASAPIKVELALRALAVAP
jgi:serine kinase of HPr protein (carbohydrate metabolism regulator)